MLCDFVEKIERKKQIHFYYSHSSSQSLVCNLHNFIRTTKFIFDDNRFIAWSWEGPSLSEICLSFLACAWSAINGRCYFNFYEHCTYKTSKWKLELRSSIGKKLIKTQSFVTETKLAKAFTEATVKVVKRQSTCDLYRPVWVRIAPKK